MTDAAPAYIEDVSRAPPKDVCRPADINDLHGAEVLVAEHPNLTDIESIEVANQAEVIVREAMLERERILDAQ